MSKQNLSKIINFGQICRIKKYPPQLKKLIIKTNSANKNIRIIYIYIYMYI